MGRQMPVASTPTKGNEVISMQARDTNGFSRFKIFPRRPNLPAFHIFFLFVSSLVCLFSVSLHSVNTLMKMLQRLLETEVDNSDQMKWPGEVAQ